MIAGRGWIALALVVFGTWMTGRVFFGALLFGAVSLGGLAAQAQAVPLELATPVEPDTISSRSWFWGSSRPTGDC